jgi:hypothetical protein
MPRDPARIVIVDDGPDEPVIVTSYRTDGERIEAAVMPGRALALAEDLLGAARRRLCSGKEGENDQNLQ